MKKATPFAPLKHPSSPAFIIAPRRLRIPDAAKYIASTNWFMETLLREGDIPYHWSGKYKVVDVKELDAYVDRQAQSAKRGIHIAA
jgi:hypothetical protein